MSGIPDYTAFIKSKVLVSPNTGYEIDTSDIHPMLFPHQRDIVQWAVRGGRRAIFAAFGLGKTFMQIEAVRLVCEKSGGRGLIIAPLGVRGEFARDAVTLGTSIKFIRTIAEAGETGIYITNYETVRDGKLDPNEFTAVSLDEASILRSYGSKTYQTFLGLFQKVRFRFVATATPSPNRFKELIHYAGFLGVMDTGQALTRFFQRDSTKANNLTLYPHKEGEFWAWLGSWAAFVQKPSDLGYDDAGYDLPPMKVIYHEVKADDLSGGIERDGQHLLIRDLSASLSETAKVKRDSISVRVEKVAEIIASAPDEHYLIWHDLETERAAIEKSISNSVSIYGSQDLEKREAIVAEFSDGLRPILAAKPVLAGSGCNFQRHCHKAIFMGIGFKFNDFIQAIHRIYRFMQSREVEIHIIYSELECDVLKTLQTKWAQHNHMVENMSELIKEHGLGASSLSDALKRSIGTERVEVNGGTWTFANNDCVEETRGMAENSLDLIVTSIPFSNHYEYTPSYNDFGHTTGDDHFFAQMDFLSPELLRILKPGRLACIHVKDRIMFGNVTGKGMPTVNPFHATCIAHYIKHGFAYMGMITVVTDVVRENNQTYRLGWSENAKDGTKMGVGSPEYILLMRKLPSDTGRAYADDPVAKSKQSYNRAKWQVDAHAFWRSGGDRLLTTEEMCAMQPSVLAKAFTENSLKQIYDYEAHVRIGSELEFRGALPADFMAIAPGSHHNDVWHDVNRMLTLNGEQSRRGLEFHVCPLQFDIVDRLIVRYSNEGDLVFDPFGGLGTVPMRALKLKRKGRGVELNPGYFRDAVRYLALTEKELATPSLFDALEAAA